MSIRDRIQCYLFCGGPRWALPLLLLIGCAPTSQPAAKSVTSLHVFRIAAAHVATIRPDLPDTLEKNDDQESGADDVDARPRLVLYRPSWQSLSEEGVDQEFHVEQRDSKLLPEQIKRRKLRLPVVQWDNGDRWYSAEYRGPEEFRAMRLRMREQPKQQPVVQSNNHWTHPGNIFDHLRNEHGQNPVGLTTEQALTLHDQLHERAISSQSCPGGVCPRVRRRR